MHQPKSRDQLAFERLLFFSDAVFAIAITILVIDVRVPSIQGDVSDADLGFALLKTIPNISGYVISFFLIGQTWIEHHKLCNFLESYNPGLLWKNLLLLLFVAFMPFATSLVSEYYMSRLAICVYAFSFAGLGFAKAWFWRHAVRTHLLAADVAAADVAGIGRRVWATPMTSLGVLVLAVLGVPYTYCGFTLIPFVAFLLGRPRAMGSS